MNMNFGLRELTKNILILFILFSVQTVFAQVKTDSLLLALKQQSNKDNAFTYLELAKDALNNSPLTAIAYATEGIKLADDTGNDKIKIELISIIAKCYRLFGNYNRSLEQYIEALEIAENIDNEKLIADVQNQIGNVYNYLGDLVNATEYYHKALEIRTKIKDSIGIAGSYNNLGNIFKVKNQNDKALEFLNKSLAIKQKIGKEKIQVSTLKNIGNIYINLEEYDEAMLYFQKALNIEHKIADSLGIGHAYISVAEVFYKKSELDSAEFYLNRSLAMNTKLNAKHNILRCYLLFADIYKAKKNFRKSVEFHEKYIELSGKIYQKELIQQAGEITTLYEIQKKEEEITLLELQEQKLLRNIFTGIIFVVLIIVIVLVNRYQLKARLSNALLKTNKDLEKEKINAEKANELKSEFLAQMSHEIRTPINTILNYTWLLKSELKNNVSDDLQGGFESIENGANRLLRTIDLILNTSQIESGAYSPEIKSINIDQEIISPVYQEFSERAKKKGLVFEKEIESDNLLADLDIYTSIQLFSNLIDNAIKYTDKGEVFIRLFMANSKIIAEVSDTGIGISEKYLPDLFNKFTQEEQGYTRKFEGTGLGLTLVKHYCEINNIEISVESKKNIGTKFILTFN